MKGTLKMKSKFLVLGVMLSCLLSLSACGAESQSDASSNSKYPVGFFNQTAIENVNNELAKFKLS